MGTASRAGRWVFYALAAGAVLVIALRIGVGIYLSTTAGKEMVAREISKRIGLPVEVRAIRLGMRSTNASLRVLDPKLSSIHGEILGIESATVDISFFGLLLGHTTPQEVDLNGVTLILQLDLDGKVVTSTPKSEEGAAETTTLPKINLSGANISVQQDGRPPFSVKNLNRGGDPQSSGEAAITGRVDDPAWGEWKLTGHFNIASQKGSVDLSGDDAPLAQNLLVTIPVVPTSVWSHIHPDGRGAVDLNLSKAPNRDLEYTISIRPAGANLTIADANTTLTNITGLIRFVGTRLELQGVQSNLAGGTIALDGKVDFGSEPTKAALKVA